MKKFLSKIKNVLLIVMSLTIVIIGVLLYQEKQENKRQYELFLNHFYAEVESVIGSLDSLLQGPVGGKDMERALLYVEQHLNRAGSMLIAGSYYMNWEINGINSIFANHPLVQFADDNILSVEEIQYLENLKKDLIAIQTGLYSDETGQEDPDLSVSGFNRVIKGSETKSGFLTEHKTVSVPFQTMKVEQVPERIHKWIEKNAYEEQKKVFLVDDVAYVLIVPAQGQTATITDMNRMNNGIHVTQQIEERLEDSDSSAIAMAALEMEEHRYFQFISESESKTKSIEEGNKQQVSVSGVTELVQPEKLSRDGRIQDK